MSCRRTYILDKKKSRENTDDRMLIQALQGRHLYKLENKGSLGIAPTFLKIWIRGRGGRILFLLYPPME